MPSSAEVLWDKALDRASLACWLHVACEIHCWLQVSTSRRCLTSGDARFSSSLHSVERLVEISMKNDGKSGDPLIFIQCVLAGVLDAAVAKFWCRKATTSARQMHPEQFAMVYINNPQPTKVILPNNSRKQLASDIQTCDLWIHTRVPTACFCWLLSTGSANEAWRFRQNEMEMEIQLQ